MASHWSSIIQKHLQVSADGSYETVTADFRKYACVEDSIADHSAYLLGAMNGSKKRYEGIAGMMDYKKVAELIENGGYATSLTYVEKLCSIIEKWNLTQYDVKETASEPEKWYRVRKSWAEKGFLPCPCQHQESEYQKRTGNSFCKDGSICRSRCIYYCCRECRSWF